MSLKHWVYFFLLFLNAILSVTRWRLLNNADRCIALLLFLTVLTEAIGLGMSLKSQNNLLVYRIYGSIAFLITALYFRRSVFVLRQSYIWWIAVGTTILMQGFLSLTSDGNASFLLIEATLIIIFCLFSIRQVLLNTEFLPYRFAHFWLTCAFLLYWSLTFTGWGVISVVNSTDDTFSRIFFQLLLYVNLGFYTATAFILLCYKKLIPSGE